MKNGKRIPIHMISLKQNENTKDIYTIQDLFYIVVRVDPYRSTGPAQCYICQQNLQMCGMW